MLKRFKIIKDSHFNKDLQRCPDFVPWDLVAPHEKQAKENHSQTLERLNERGGLSPKELYAVVNDKSLSQWDNLPSEKECIDWIIEIMEEHIRTGVIKIEDQP